MGEGMSALLKIRLTNQRGHPRAVGPLFACALAVALLLFLLSACGGASQPAENPLARYEPALREEFRSHLADLTDLTRYEIDVTLDPSLEVLTGTAEIAVTNSSPDPWTYLIFRLYPALNQYDGLLSVRSAAVNGRAVPFSYREQNSVMRIELPFALLSGQKLSIYLSWVLDIPGFNDTEAAYRLFGQSQQILSLPLFYPSLAVYQSGPTVDTGRWWIDQGTIRGDAAFNHASLFVVTATLPIDQVPVTSGSLVTSTVPAPGRARYIWVTGPSREFLLHMSSEFEQESLVAYGTRITSYWMPGHESAGKAALQHTAASLRIFSDVFGPYPYTDLRVAAAPLGFRGMEYPQAYLLGIQLYDRFRNELEIRAVHETAHQWWYQLVHNDPVNHPWMDEGISEYATRLYYEAMRGVPFAQTLQLRRWQAVVDILAGKGEETNLDLPVNAFVNGSQYEGIVYGKGALFFDAVRDLLGERDFRLFLKEYLDENRYKIVEPVDLLEVLRRYSPEEADRLYATWIGEPPPPLITDEGD